MIPRERERFVQYVQSEPMAAAQLRAPLYEDKVVDFLFGRAEITDRASSRAELEAAIEEDDTGGHVHGPGCGHDHGDAKPAKTKKAAAPKATKAGVDTVTEVAPKPATKKPVAKKAIAPVEAEAVAVEPVKKAETKKAPAKKASA